MKLKNSASLKVLGVVILLNGLFFSGPLPAFGDGEVADAEQVGTRLQTPTTRQYNERLPPVLPGEEVVTETGQKMRVWSSAGPVPVNPQPTSQPLPDSRSVGGVGVIVDSRR